MDDSLPESEPSTGQRVTGALKAAGKSLASGKFWLTHLAIASAITLATCWLPGSQLITIPIYLAVAGACQAGAAAKEGYNHPFQVGKTKPANAIDPELQPDSPKAQAPPPASDLPVYHPKRLWGGVKGMGKQVIHDFKAHFILNALISGLITLATCWLPGSQLLTIPAWYCMDSAFSAVRGAYRGWKDPNYSPSKANKDPEHA
jgi:hypothetical protein